MRIIAGLGNPGPRYRNTRHNAGFEALDRLAARCGVAFDREKHQALIAEARRDNETLVLIKPLTFMNRSGLAVAPFVRYAPNGPEDLIAVVDDAELPLGRLRLRARGSSGGHKGLKSIIEHVGGEDFARLRIGVGKEPGGAGLADHVLGRFRPEERNAVDAALERAVEGLLCCLDEGLTAAMNRVNAPAD